MTIWFSGSSKSFARCHKGTSIMVASKDPPSVLVSLIELSTHIILHKFNSPAWLKHVQKSSYGVSNTGNGFEHLARPGGIIEHARRPRHPVVLTQHRPPILGAEEPAPLQDRDHLGGESVELRRQQGGHDVETVRRAGGETVLNEIGNLLRRADGDV